MRLRAVTDGDDPVAPPVALAHPPGRLALPAGTIDPLVTAAGDPDDPLSVAAGALGGLIAAARRADGAPVRLVTVIGAGAEAQAALIAANLAAAAALAGDAVLLIDAAIGRGSQHSLFRLPNHAGVSTLLAGHDAVPAIQPTALPGLSLLASGPRAAAGDRPFDRARLFDRVRGAAERAALAVLLAPADPAQAVAAAEGSDGAVLVVRQDRSDARRVRALRAALGERGVPVIAAVRTR